MSDSSNTVKKYHRDIWTLADLRLIVTDTTGWDPALPVRLSGSVSGVVEVIGAE